MNSTAFIVGAAIAVAVAFANTATNAFAASDSVGPMEGLPVTIALRGCGDIPSSIVYRVLTAELHAVVSEEREQPSTPDTTRVDVQCDPNQLVHLRVIDPLTGKTVQRTIDLGAEDEVARPRLLALSIAELVAASWIELTTKPSRTAVRMPEVTASSQTRRAVLAVDRPGAEPAPPFLPFLELLATASGRTFQSGSLTTFGGGGTLTRVQREWLAVTGGFLAERGHERTALGTVSATLGSVALQASLRGVFGRVAIESGVGGRMGFARFSGKPEGASIMAEGDTLTAAWGGPQLGGNLHIGFRNRFLISFSAEAGYVMRPIAALAGARRAVAIDGFWLGGSVGLGIRR